MPRKYLKSLKGIIEPIGVRKLKVVTQAALDLFFRRQRGHSLMLEGSLKAACINQPIVYIFWGRNKTALYVGMSTRGIGRPFAGGKNHNQWILRDAAQAIEIIFCDSEAAAVLLETALIAEYRPEGNRTNDPMPLLPSDAPKEPVDGSALVQAAMIAADKAKQGIPPWQSRSFAEVQNFWASKGITYTREAYDTPPPASMMK